MVDASPIFVIIVRSSMVFQLYKQYQIDGLAQDWSNSIANALELLQSCTEPSKWRLVHKFDMGEVNLLVFFFSFNTILYVIVCDIELFLNRDCPYSTVLPNFQQIYFMESASLVLQNKELLWETSVPDKCNYKFINNTWSWRTNIVPCVTPYHLPVLHTDCSQTLTVISPKVFTRETP